MNSPSQELIDDFVQDLCETDTPDDSDTENVLTIDLRWLRGRLDEFAQLLLQREGALLDQALEIIANEKNHFNDKEFDNGFNVALSTVFYKISRMKAQQPTAPGGEVVRQPELTVVINSYPESNGKRNWTAQIRRVEPWDGLIGNAGGITVGRGEYWNRVAYAAEEARYLLGLRDTEPWILDYGNDIETPEQWQGEKGRQPRKAAAPSPAKEKS